ncbi:HAD family hydrolase [Streptomyces sp. NHF165]|uniref:HAD family hydrolase n=1 Tax=Streptomyces sp. NHF165 TaxID=2175864 RepID=UPI0022773DC5|nr:HAD family phosphatase [Streptomyces sp. NHF165]
MPSRTPSSPPGPTPGSDPRSPSGPAPAHAPGGAPDRAAGPASGPAGAALPAALLCDMDGTLVDTERDWLATIAALLAEHTGHTANTGHTGSSEHGPDGLDTYAGLPLADAAERLAERIGTLTPETVRARLDETFTARVRAGVAVQPGALALLDSARDLGVPVALVTASERPVADLVLATLGTHRFACSVTAGETSRGKPHPDPYLAAAATLGVRPEDCLAVEDTPTGAASALAAGCRVLAVPTVDGIAPGPRTLLVASLAEADLTALPWPPAAAD